MKARHILISSLFMALAGGAMAQSSAPVAPSSTATNGAPSNDPFVQKRQADADAKAQYKAEKKAAKQEYKQDRAQAKAQLKQERQESTAQRNEALATTPAAPVDKSH
ncbi:MULTISPECIES: hypothetical protein [Herbaspirillum]|uniref:Uncharacterized protein n=1 Tax=Herbaspirillum seropedicae (strain SmR1) TaxID=757424 RepID=D8ITT4_HERSS|nr:MULTISPECIES: hypothetical protein [Herbaspirillum]ADJ61575.1 hypothetical protein Hsero_0045 [Herbaspirillum seropedicae SmR1]AKN63796.1 hypothetical protein ACP92_00230 [Herbaspirillum seropedicae]MDR6398364.1 hypothetical protein [Herbaspirillum seropedicae]NQE30150.1 hypothetical protein [Herbaspirillum seropedicae]UMU19705.1 hypothetical protein G5B88_00235 [Herbaspirillum seropedicae]